MHDAGDETGTPVAPADLDDVAEIAVGERFTCARRTDGGVRVRPMTPVCHIGAVRRVSPGETRGSGPSSVGTPCETRPRVPSITPPGHARRSSRRPPRLAVTVLAVAALALTACGDEDDDGPRLWVDPPTDAVEIAQGGSVRFDLGATGVVSAELVTEPTRSDWVTLRVEGTGAGGARLHVVLAHDAPATATRQVEILLTAADGRQERRLLNLDVQGLVWGDVAPWDPGEAEGPQWREHGVALVTPDEDAVFVTQGSGYRPQFVQMLDDVWRYDLIDGGWSRVTPTGGALPGAGSRRAAPGREPGEWLLFGGYREPPTVLDDLVVARLVPDPETPGGETLDFEVLPRTEPWPEARSLHAFVRAGDAPRWILFGGVATSVDGVTVFDDTWELTFDAGGAPVWERLDLGPGPSPRYGFFHGAVEGPLVRPGLVVFSGAGEPTPADPVAATDDAWLLPFAPDDGGTRTWVPLEPAGDAPPGRRNGCGLVGLDGGTLYVWGGTADARTTAPGLFALDLRLDRWVDLSDRPAPGTDPPAPPPARSSGFGFALSDGTVACGFGNGADVYADLWAFGP